jgi:hydrogenase nickel incorporation protein HypA/HybF
MHELGVVMEIVKTVEDFARDHGVRSVATLVLQVGELSSVIPRYLRECFPAAADGTLLQETELEIEVLPGVVRCRDCSREYNLLEHRQTCPGCGGRDWDLVSGKEFVIKEIRAC